MKTINFPHTREDVLSRGETATLEIWEKRCDNIAYYIDKKTKEVNEAADILSETQKTTQSSDNDRAPAISEKKTSKQRLKDSLPSVVEFAVMLGVSKQTLYNWAKEHDDFSEQMDSLQNLSELAINNALQMGYLDNIYGKFLLAAVHNYRERTDITTNGNDLPQPLLNGASNDTTNNRNK